MCQAVRRDLISGSLKQFAILFVPLQNHPALPAIRQTIMDYMDTLAIGQDLVLPALHAICYSAESNPAPTFAISQILGLVSGGTATSGVISATWKQRFSIPSASFITITVDN